MIFNHAKWIWNSNNRRSYNMYLQARKEFDLDSEEYTKILSKADASLRITADAQYQVWLNGHVIGHGPAKSAEGKRSVDEYNITSYLKTGVNQLDILVLSIGTGTMTYCVDDAGLIFQLNLGGRILGSDETTLVRKDLSRNSYTARRWILPCMEDVHAGCVQNEWVNAKVVEKETELYIRRVSLPSRTFLSPKRMVSSDVVLLPNFSYSFRLRPYLAKGDEVNRHNLYECPAYIITDIISPVEQELTFTPALGHVEWYYEGNLVYTGNGWSLPDLPESNRTILLKKGVNRLIGVHDRKNHFEDINLVGFVEQEVRIQNPYGAGGYQIVLMEGKELKKGKDLLCINWDTLKNQMPVMDPSHTLYDGNPQDLAVGAKVIDKLELSAVDRLEIPARTDGLTTRIILDLGMVHCGWLNFEAIGSKEGCLIFSFLESIDDGASPVIQWPSGMNNALRYQLRDGYQRFESFFPYGVRYIMIHYTGSKPVTLYNLGIYTANCGHLSKGFLHTSDLMIDSIYKIAEQTVQSSSDDTYVDCPTFEQVNWNMDSRLASYCEYYTFARKDIIQNSIQLFAEDPRFNRLVRNQYPSAWDSLIPMFSFHWMMWCKDYYDHTEDIDFIQKVFPRIAAGIEESIKKIGKYGLLEFTGEWHFIEWAHGRDDDHAINAGEQAGFIGAVKAAVYLAEMIGGQYEVQARKWLDIAENVVKAIHQYLWNEEKQLFVDSIHEDGRISEVSSQVTNAMMIVYGVVERSKGKAILERIISQDGSMIPFGSPFGLYYILEALDCYDYVEEIFKHIRKRWGDMVLAGDATTWETFAEFGHGVFPTRSRCHGFSSYIVKYIVKYIMGIQRIKPGFKEFKVKPNPPTGIESCQGVIPTGHGLIRVSWLKEDHDIKLQVDYPKELKWIMDE